MSFGFSEESTLPFVKVREEAYSELFGPYREVNHELNPVAKTEPDFSHDRIHTELESAQSPQRVHRVLDLAHGRRGRGFAVLPYCAE